MKLSGLLAVAVVGGCSFSGPESSGTVVDAADVDAAEDAADRADASDAALVMDADIDAPIDAPRADWWDGMYPYRFPILVTNGAALPVGYQLAIDANVSGAPCNVTGPRQSLRIAKADTTADLTRFIESGTGANLRIWFRLPVALAAGTAQPTGYYLYCGAPAPTPPTSSPAMIFDFFDAFDGTSLASTWTVGGTGGTVTVGSGEVSIPVGRTIRTTLGAGLGPAHVMELTTHKTATNGQYWGGWQSGTGYEAPWMVWIARQPNAVRPELFDPGDADYTRGIDIAIDSASHTYAIEYQRTAAYYRMDGGAESFLTQDVTAALGLRFENYDSNAPYTVMEVRVRQAVRPAPSVALGPVEMY